MRRFGPATFISARGDASGGSARILVAFTFDTTCAIFASLGDMGSGAQQGTDLCETPSYILDSKRELVQVVMPSTSDDGDPPRAICVSLGTATGCAHILLNLVGVVEELLLALHQMPEAFHHACTTELPDSQPHGPRTAHLTFSSTCCCFRHVN